MATTGGIPALMEKATMTQERAMFEAADRSIPPLMMIRVIPKAPSATITDWVATLLKLATRRNLSCTSGIKENIARTRINPKNGASQLMRYFRRVFSFTNEN